MVCNARKPRDFLLRVGKKTKNRSALDRFVGRPLTLGGSKSGRRDSDPRPSPWQGDVLPLYYSRITVTIINRTSRLSNFKPAQIHFNALRAASRPSLITIFAPGTNVPTASAPMSNKSSFSRTLTSCFLICPASARSSPVSASNSTT